MKKLFIMLLTFTSLSMLGLSKEARDKGFVYLHEIDPTIQTSVRYATTENFLGRPANGYLKPVIILHIDTARALSEVQKALAHEGYELVVYDGYRPQRACDNFMSWRVDLDDQIKKEEYYPYVDKERVLELGYVADKSSHSRGSTTDLTIIKKGKKVHPIKHSKRTLLNGKTYIMLDDGTVDMGTPFDLFDVASHHENDVVPEEFKQLRSYLKEIMMRFGFTPYAEEWWHYTLKNEPYKKNDPRSYHDYVIE